MSKLLYNNQINTHTALFENLAKIKNVNRRGQIQPINF